MLAVMAGSSRTPCVQREQVGGGGAGERSPHPVGLSVPNSWLCSQVLEKERARAELVRR